MALYAGIGVGVAAVLAAVAAFFVYRSRQNTSTAAGGTPHGKPNSKASSTADVDADMDAEAAAVQWGAGKQQGCKPPQNPTPPSLDSLLGIASGDCTAPTLPSMLPFTLTVDDSQAALQGQGQAR